MGLNSKQSQYLKESLEVVNVTKKDVNRWEGGKVKVLSGSEDDVGLTSDFRVILDGRKQRRKSGNERRMSCQQAVKGECRSCQRPNKAPLPPS